VGHHANWRWVLPLLCARALLMVNESCVAAQSTVAVRMAVIWCRRRRGSTTELG
jgi:hypothetical protein